MRAHTIARVRASIMAAAITALPAGLAFADTVTFTQAGIIRVPSDTVEVRVPYVYVAGDKKLTIFDISTPAAPKAVGAYTFPEQIWSFRLSGDYAYVAANFFGLGIVDISNPAAPTLRASFKTPGQAKSVAVVGTRALVADHMTGIDLVDLTTIDKPAGLGSFFVEGYARDVTAGGSLAYAIDAPTGLYVIDPARPGPPDAVAEVQTASAPQNVEIMGGGSGGGPKLACLVGGGSLQVYDISNAEAAPVHVVTFRTPSGRPQRISVQGRRAYIADGAEGLLVVDLTTPSSPAIVGRFKTPLPARDVAAGEAVVLVVVGDGKTEEVLILKPSS